MSAAASISGGLLRGLAAGRGIKLDEDRREADAAREEASLRRASLGNGTDPRAGAHPPAGGPLIGLIDQTESAGDYNALYSHAQREGGRFAGTTVTDMTLEELYDFTDPSGEYGQYVADARTSAGEERQVATPLGRYQVVGSTLRAAADQMDLDPSVKFTPEVQQSVASHLIAQRLGSAQDMDGKVKALRQEWAGLNKIPARDLAAAIIEWEGR